MHMRCTFRTPSADVHSRPFMARAASAVREHAVLAVSMALAAATMVAVPPDAQYLGYIDWRTLGCLFSVLAVANAFRYIGAFDRAARMAIDRFDSPRSISLALVAATAVLSMVATNDLALVVMLPLSAMTLVKAGCPCLLPATFAMQSIAANLCGMIVPFGNPQNLYLYSFYSIGLLEFLRTMGPPFAASVALVALASWVLTTKAPARKVETGKEIRMPVDRRRFAVYVILLAIAMLAVFRLVHVAFTVVAVTGVLALADRRALKAVDYSLLLTFVCFFVFAGNLARVPALSDFATGVMASDGVLAAAGLSQFVSNVPAAVLLSHFTADWQALLVGTNIGGVGTVVGSLASLITLRHFATVRKVFPELRNERALDVGRFFGLFAAANLAFFAVLLPLCVLFL